MSEIANVPKSYDFYNSHFPQPPQEERERAAQIAIDGLAGLDKELMATYAFSPWQRNFWITVAILVVAGFAIWPVQVGSSLVGFLVVLYGLTLYSRSRITIMGLTSTARNENILPVEIDDLPIYSILMPAFDEPEVIRNLVRAVDAIDYPKERLELLLLLEEDDNSTIDSLIGVELPTSVRVLLVPPSEPRTKPKACNYGLQFARGKYVTIFDAEDVPQPMQLRDAVELFESSPDDVACLQARLDYFNYTQNLLTRLFTVEYATWFGCILPGLQRLKMPIPLGGTSNHIKTNLLIDLGGWDPYNVTEDADLGIRLVQRGYRTLVLDSVTFEEANSDTVNWIRQRSRWYKGYLQTWLVHMRQPRATLGHMGPRGVLGITTVIGLTPALAAVNLFAAFLTVLFFIGVPASLTGIFPPWVVYVGSGMFFFGNAFVILTSIMAMIRMKKEYLALTCLVFPLYWLLMAVAATKAVYQLIVRPSYWEKTQHGLTDESAE